MDTTTFRDAMTSAIGFWERWRPGYNLLLAAVVVACFIAALPGSREALALDTGLQLFALAVVANIAFCAAYVVDVAVQLSGYRAAWLRWRWLLLAIGSLFAATLARFVALGIFGPGGHG